MMLGDHTVRFIHHGMHYLRVDPATNDISKRFDFARVSREIKILETSEKNKSYMDRSGRTCPST